MTDDNNNQIIQCPRCRASVTVSELGKYVNANPEIKKQAIEEEIQLWGDAYDMQYLTLNLVFCPRCHKVSHFKDWSSGKK